MFSTIIIFLHCVSKNDTGLARYNSDDHQLILVIFGRGRNVAERLSCQTLICFPTTSNLRLCTTWGDMNPKIVSFHINIVYCFNNKHTYSNCHLVTVEPPSVFVTQEMLAVVKTVCGSQIFRISAKQRTSAWCTQHSSAAAVQNSISPELRPQ